MFLFVAYAVAIWYLACRHRRSWAGVGVILVGLIGCGIVAWLHWRLYIWSEGRIYLRVLQVLLYPYALMLTAVATFFVILPRRVAPEACRTCLYDMAGLIPEISSCPECGASWSPPVQADEPAESVETIAAGDITSEPRPARSPAPIPA